MGLGLGLGLALGLGLGLALGLGLGLGLDLGLARTVQLALDPRAGQAAAVLTQLDAFAVAHAARVLAHKAQSAARVQLARLPQYRHSIGTVKAQYRHSIGTSRTAYAWIYARGMSMCMCMAHVHVHGA